LRRNQPEAALELLKNTDPFKNLSADFLRGLAHKNAGRHKEAAALLQGVVDRYGAALVEDPILFEVAHLELARTHVALGDTAKAKALYEKFLSFLKNPDPDLVLVREARAELAKIN
jgi:tetratricopeptide (TPR) repeat protein